MDATPTGHFGQGGTVSYLPHRLQRMGQKMPEAEKAKLTCRQREPLSKALC